MKNCEHLCNLRQRASLGLARYCSKTQSIGFRSLALVQTPDTERERERESFWFVLFCFNVSGSLSSTPSTPVTLSLSALLLTVLISIFV